MSYKAVVLREEQFIERWIKKSIESVEDGFGIVGVDNINNSAFALGIFFSLYKVPLGTLLPDGSKVGREYVECRYFTHTEPSDGLNHEIHKFFMDNIPKWERIDLKRS